MKEERHIRNYQLAVLIGSLLVILMLLTAWMISGPAQEWKGVQSEYRKIMEGITDSIPGLEASGEMKGIMQYELTELGRTDRCITCHMGMENPYTAEEKQPFSPHPGALLAQHPPEKYGCTVCHKGQGLALNKQDAFGRDDKTHWGEPMLTDKYIQSSCGQCHLAIYDPAPALASTEIFQRGKEIFSREGCLGCHKARGLGGIVGPDLTEQGEKTKHDYNFQNIRGEQTVSNWLKEHFKDPEMVSPGSQMLKIDLPEEELDALTTFVLGLARPDISFDYFTLDALNELKGKRVDLSGERLFDLSCSGCHGKAGNGKDYSAYETGVPGILNADFRRMASSDYIGFTLEKGRSRRMMASWMTGISGMREGELGDLTAVVKHGEEGVAFRTGLLRAASSANGGEVFRNHCAACHGEQGSGGLAISLQRKEMLEAASDVYLYKTIKNGRGNTAMPGWMTLAETEVYDVMKYLRTHGVYRAGMHVDFSGGDAAEGALQYRFLCSRCHGESGQGQTGPALINRDFMEAASDGFLYQTISFGRDHTAMFGWSVDVYNNEQLDRDEIGDIVAFMRDESRKRPAYIYAGANPGNAEAGAPLYKENCAKCHGDAGEGKEAPALNNQEFLSAASNGYVVGTITIGREGTKMPRWGSEGGDHVRLSDDQRKDITAFIRNWQRISIKN